MKLFKTISYLLSHLLPMTWIRKLSPRGRLILEVTTGASLVILIPLALGLHFGAQKAEAVWLDDNFAYRQIVALTNSGSAQTDYQVKITLDTATLITAGKMLSTCYDIRVTDINGKLLPHWVEGGSPGCNNAATEIWTKVPSIPTSGATLYIYYGNPSATTNRENPSKVFDFFDDFKSVDTARYTDTTGTNTIVAEGYDSSSVDTTGDANDIRYFTNTTFSATTGYAVKARMVEDSIDGGLFFETQNSANGYLVTSRRTGGTTAFEWYKRVTDQWTSLATHTSVPSWTSTEQRTLEIIRTGGNTLAVKDNESAITGYTATTDTTYTSGGVGIRGSSQQTIDWLFVRKAASTEPAVASPATEEKAPSPVAYWKFDEGTGTNAQDATTNNLDGTLGGSVPPAWKTEDQCIVGKCLYFDGSAQANNGKVTVTQASTTPTNITGDLTLSAWIKPTANYLDNPGYFIRNGQGADQVFALHYDYTLKRVNFGWYDGTFKQVDGASNSVPINQWSHIQITRSGTTLNIYVNGKFNATGTSTTPTPQASSLSMGQTNNDAVAQDYTGFLDEVKIYNYARSAAQIQADFNARSNNEGASGVLGASNNQPAALSNGLVGYWKMDESSWTQNCTATSVTDSSGNGNNGKSCPSTTGPTTGVGKFGNGGVFDGTGDTVSIAHHASLKPSAQITISAWVNPTNITTNNFYEIYRKEDGADRHLLSFQANGTILSFGLGTATQGYQELDVSITSTDYTGGWHLITAIYDGQNKYLYRDGIRIGSQTATGAIGTTGTAIAYIGSSGGSDEFFNGKIDEARVYNRALSAADVSTLYNFAPGPYTYLSFDEGTGTTINDKSGNGYSGTWNGSGTNRWRAGKYGKAGYFDGSTDYVSFSSLPSPSTNGPITIQMWVNSASASPVGIFDSAPNVADVLRNYSAGNVEWWNGSPSVSLGLTANTWTHLAFTFEFSGGIIRTLKYYKNGVLQANSSTGVTPTYAWTTFRLGNINGGSAGWYTGYVDEFKIYNYARSQGQIIEDMNAGHPAPGSPVGTPVGHWKFDEGYSTTANNSGSQGSTLQGTLTSMASPATSTSGWTQAGKFGKALNFDGTNDVVTVTDNNALDLPTTFTLSGWIKSTVSNDGNFHTILAKMGAADPSSYKLYLKDTGTIGLYNGASGAFVVSGSTVLSINTWYYIAATYDGTTAKVYVNGAQDGSVSYSTSFGSTTDALRFGTNTVGGASPQLFSGSMDEMKIYGQALTADQIKLDMNRSSSQVLGALSDNSSYQVNAANQEYCVPGDSTSCVAPVGRWDFEEGTSTVVNDTSGNANTGTWNGTGTAHWKPGKIGKGGNFNGSDDYVSSANSISTGTSGTMGAWIKPSGTYTSPQTVMGGTNAGGSNVSGRYYISAIHTGVCASGDWWVNIANGTTNQFVCSGQVYNSTNFPVNTWTYLVATYDGSNVKFYKDGRLVNTVAQTVSGAGDAQPFSIGRPGGASVAYFNGGIDQVRVFNYARSAAQVAWDYNKGAPVGWWKMDECQGTVANDSSGNGNVGTITIGGDATYTSVGTCNTSSSTTMWGAGAIGKRNYSLGFGGGGNYVPVSDSATTDPQNAWTLSAWIKRSATGTLHGILEKYDWLATKGNYAMRITSGDKLIAYLVNGQTTQDCGTTTTTISSGTWYHVTATFDTATNSLICYVNGKAEATNSSATFETMDSTGTMKIGTQGDGPANSFNGQIDDVRVYNYALTSTQVKTLYTGGALNFSPSTGAP